MNIKIPAFYQHHWPNGKAASAWTDKEITPAELTPGWIAVFHPAHELEVNEHNVAIEKLLGSAHKVTEVNLNDYRKLGTKLSWKQRWNGII